MPRTNYENYNNGIMEKLETMCGIDRLIEGQKEKKGSFQTT